MGSPRWFGRVRNSISFGTFFNDFFYMTFALTFPMLRAAQAASDLYENISMPATFSIAIKL